MRRLAKVETRGTAPAIRTMRNKTQPTLMKTTSNTYSLLLRSEEKGRTIFEGLVIAAIVLSTAFTGWQFASSSVVLPGMASGVQSTTAPLVLEAAPEQAPVLLADRG